MHGHQVWTQPGVPVAQDLLATDNSLPGRAPPLRDLLITWQFSLTLIQDLPTGMQQREMVEKCWPGCGTDPDLRPGLGHLLVGDPGRHFPVVLGQQHEDDHRAVPHPQGLENECTQQEELIAARGPRTVNALITPHHCPTSTLRGLRG